MRVTGRGRLPEGAVLFVANHQDSLLDPVLITSAAKRKVRFLAKATLFDVPVLGTLMRSLGMIPAYRSQDDAAQVRRNLEILDRAAEALAAGDSVGIFPEGKSHDLPRVEQIKSGSFSAVRNTDDAPGQRWSRERSVKAVSIAKPCKPREVCRCLRNLHVAVGFASFTERGTHAPRMWPSPSMPPGEVIRETSRRVSSFRASGRPVERHDRRRQPKGGRHKEK